VLAKSARISTSQVVALFSAGGHQINGRTIKTKSRFILRNKTCVRLGGILMAGLVVLGAMGAVARTDGSAGIGKENAGMTLGRPWTGERGLQKTTAQIMADPVASKPRAQFCLKGNREIPGRRNRAQNPNALSISQFPLTSQSVNSHTVEPVLSAPQTVGTNFTGATLAETGSIPPDTMGVVGPSQFVVLVSGRLRTFDKTSGVADGALNVDPDVFFASVMTPVSPPAINFTFEPQVRYDRLSGRWDPDDDRCAEQFTQLQFESRNSSRRHRRLPPRSTLQAWPPASPR
jgi:hypothetical protein